MSENDTNPQRYEVPPSSTGNPSRDEVSEAGAGSGVPGQLMVTQQIPVPDDAGTGDPGATTDRPAPPAAASAAPAQNFPPPPPSHGGQPGWHGQPLGGQPGQPGQQVPGSGYPGYPGYPAQPVPDGPLAGAAPVPGAAPAPPGHGPWQWPGMEPTSGLPGVGDGRPGMPAGDGQPGWSASDGQPVWYPSPGIPGQPPYGTGPAQARRPGRFGRVAAGGLLALLLAGGGGVVGGLVVHAVDDHDAGSGTGTSSTSHAAAPVLERNSLASIANKIKPSVVSIQTQSAEGSGVVLSADGYVLTNNHVVADVTSGTVQVTFSSGKTATAKIVGTDAKTDLAVVKAQNVSGLTPATFGDSDALQVGDTVLAVGSPLGLEGSVTEGIVSALNRTIQESGSQQQNPFGQQSQGSGSGGTNIAGAIQTDAAINPGNSGGALVNLNAEVVGINTAIATSGSTEGNIGVGFAIPGNRAKQVADSLIKGQSVSHPYLGVNVSTADGNAGATVASVVSNSPAAKAGLKQGDLITKAGTTEIHTSDDLINVVQASKAGAQMALTITRGGSSMTVTVTIGES